MTTLKEIAKVIVLRHKIKTADAEQFIQQLVEVINEGLINDRQVKIKGFGTFKLQTVKERSSVNVNTGERVTIGEHDKVTFTPDNVMRDLINKPFAQFETVVIEPDSPLLDESETFIEDDDENESEAISAVDELVETAKGANIETEEKAVVASVSRLVADAKQTTEDIIDGAADVKENATFSVTDAIADAEETVEKAFEDATDVTETAESSVADAIADAEETVEKAFEDATDVSETAESSVADAIADAEETVEKAFEDATDVTETSESSVADTIADAEETVETAIADVAEVKKTAEPAVAETIAEAEETVESESVRTNIASLKTQEEEVEEDENEESSSEYYDDDDFASFFELFGRYAINKYSLIGFLVIGALMFALGYYAGLKGWFGGSDQQKAKVENVQPDVVQEQPVDSVVQENSAVQVSEEVKESEKVEEKAETVKEDNSESVSMDKYNKDARVRLGAYIIVGTDREVKVMEGQTLKSISKANLGPGMECYVEAYNDTKSVKAGQTIKIPKLRLKKHKK